MVGSHREGRKNRIICQQACRGLLPRQQKTEHRKEDIETNKGPSSSAAAAWGLLGGERPRMHLLGSLHAITEGNDSPRLGFSQNKKREILTSPGTCTWKVQWFTPWHGDQEIRVKIFSSDTGVGD
jgi:hypothetical protein